MKTKTGIAAAFKAIAENMAAMNEFEKKFIEAKDLVNDSKEQVERLLLKTERIEENNWFHDELVYPWIDGWNYAQVDGLIYTFRYYAEDHSISNLSVINVVKLDEEEVSDETV